jgi:lipopolysaccharide biosynthesis glycosyltransferase
MDIGTCIDEKYGPWLAAMLCSVRTHTSPDEPINVHVGTSDLTYETKCRIVKSVNSGTSGTSGNIHFFWYQVDLARWRSFPIGPDLSRITYARLELFDSLPANVEKLIYLDTDLIVLHDLLELWKQSFDDQLLFAVQDVRSSELLKFDSWNNLMADYGLEKESDYFNAGVFVINIKKWKSESYGFQAYSFIEKHRYQIRFADQDCLNGLCKGQWGRLELAWNVLPARAHEYVKSEGPKPKIVHFAGQTKPWQSESNMPFREEFFRFLEMTDWRGWRPMTAKIRTIVPKNVRSILRRLHSDALQPNIAFVRAKEKIRKLLLNSVSPNHNQS